MRIRVGQRKQTSKRLDLKDQRRKRKFQSREYCAEKKRNVIGERESGNKQSNTIAIK
jgi:hypothetical protein